MSVHLSGNLIKKKKSPDYRRFRSLTLPLAVGVSIDSGGRRRAKLECAGQRLAAPDIRDTAIKIV